MKAFAEALPWGHNIALFEKLSYTQSRLWYAAAAVEHGWSRNVLDYQIETRLHGRSGQAISNSKAVLPAAGSDLLQQTMTDRDNDGELEAQLVNHVEKFLLELGQGFAFAGRQVRPVVELKAGEHRTAGSGAGRGLTGGNCAAACCTVAPGVMRVRSLRGSVSRNDLTHLISGTLRPFDANDPVFECIKTFLC